MDRIHKPVREAVETCRVDWQYGRWAWFLGCLLLTLKVAAGADWPQYRGSNHDGISTERINTNWVGTVTNPVWKVTVGSAFSSFVFSQSRAFTQVYRNSSEMCVALNPTNGAEIWATTVDPDATSKYGGYNGARSTPSVVGDSVYILTSTLKLLRLNFTNGAVVWSNDLATAYSTDVIAWANSASPLVDQGLIYVNLNTGDQALAAFWATNGALAWRVEPENMTHSTPVAATIHGVRQVIFATQNGLVSLHGATGQKLWDYAYPNGYNGTSLAVSPVVWSNIVFISQAYTPNSTAARIDFDGSNWSANYLWDQPVDMIWMTPVIYDGAIYGATGNNNSSSTPLVCLDLMTGAQKWSYSGFGRGGVLLIDRYLVALSEAGMLRLIRPNTNAYTEIASFRALNSGSCWNTFAVADGRLYVRSSTQAAAFNFAKPDLRMAAPQWLAANQVRLTVTAADGSALTTNRLASMEVRAGTNLAQAVSLWPKLTNALTLTNGAGRMDHVDMTAKPRQFFRILETQ